MRYFENFLGIAACLVVASGCASIADNSTSSQRRNGPGGAAPDTTRAHARVIPAASGYAALANIDAVPVQANGKERYAHYLSLRPPKAFVVYEKGGWRFQSESKDAMTILLDICAKEGKTCWLYAVDDRVVWQPRMDRRISHAAQLERQ